MQLIAHPRNFSGGCHWIFHAKALMIGAAFLLNARESSFAQEKYPDPRAGTTARVNDLLHILTLEEKIALLGHENPAVGRLHIKPYNWWNEALHGVARAGEATVFPQAIGLAATFDDSLIGEVGTVISTEARAKYNMAQAAGNDAQYLGLSFWSPNINIFRDPRWGRGAETYGEDPFLTAAIGTAFVRGLQGNDDHYLKTAACAKHFAVHSGPESERHGFNAVVDEKDLRETYLYAFQKLVNAGVETVMCAYNQINGEPCCTGTANIKKILREEWKFRGQVVTDCGALYDILAGHRYKSGAELAADAIRAGLNLECGNLLQKNLAAAVRMHLISTEAIDSALAPDLSTSIRLGFFDDPRRSPYASYNSDSVHNAAHVLLARKAARESMVLLKNDGILPLQKNKYHSIMVVGANASSLDVLMGSYHGISGQMVTMAEGIAAVAGPAIGVQYDQGYDNRDSMHFGGIWAAGLSDLTIAVVGLNPVMEGEEGDAFLSESGGDRRSLSLPPAQVRYLQKLHESAHKPLILVVTGGSAVDLSPVLPLANAVIFAWYPGEQGGLALADILFGAVSPSGHLPITFYQSLSQLPDYKDYAMRGRTYRYFGGPVQFPFGYGLSYTKFDYRWEKKAKDRYHAGDTITIAVGVGNKGEYDGNASVQSYIRYPDLPRMPLKELKSFKKVFVEKGRDKIVTLRIPVAELQKWNPETHDWKLYPGIYAIIIGEDSREERLTGSFTVQ